MLLNDSLRSVQPPVINVNSSSEKAHSIASCQYSNTISNETSGRVSEGHGKLAIHTDSNALLSTCGNGTIHTDSNIAASANSHTPLHNTDSNNVNMTLDARASIETRHANAAAISESLFSGEYVDCDHKTSAQKGKFKIVRVRSKYVSKYCYAVKKHSRERLVARRNLGKQSGESKSEQYLDNSTNSNSAKRCSTSITAVPSTAIDSHKYNNNMQNTISSLETIATDDLPEVSITPSKCIAIESSAMSRTTSSSSNESCDFCTFNKFTIEIGTIIRKIIPTEFHSRSPDGSILPEDKDYVFRSSHYTSGKPGPTMYLKMRCWIVVARYDKHAQVHCYWVQRRWY
jgi:hypothetical protein